jgi:hypothetical protein
LGWLGFCSAAEFAVTHNMVSNVSADVCLWHKADIQLSFGNVRFWG